jgi:hypothetical protein
MIGDEFGRMNGRRGTPHDVETGRDRLTDFIAAIKPKRQRYTIRQRHRGK